MMHADHKEKYIVLFQRQRESIEKSKLHLMNFAKTENEKLTEASYHVSYRIALYGVAHSIGE
jgi:hypothetical protein